VVPRPSTGVIKDQTIINIIINSYSEIQGEDIVPRRHQLLCNPLIPTTQIVNEGTIGHGGEGVERGRGGGTKETEVEFSCKIGLKL